MTARLFRTEIGKPHMTKKRALALKNAILQVFPRQKSNAYQDKVKQLLFHFKIYPELVQEVDPVILVKLSDAELLARLPLKYQQSHTPVHAANRDMLKTLLQPETLDEEQLASHAPMARCGKCGGAELDFESRQLRSIDEPMTIFYFCLNPVCLHRWHI